MLPSIARVNGSRPTKDMAVSTAYRFGGVMFSPWGLFMAILEKIALRSNNNNRNRTTSKQHMHASISPLDRVLHNANLTGFLLQQPDANALRIQ